MTTGIRIISYPNDSATNVSKDDQQLPPDAMVDGDDTRFQAAFTALECKDPSKPFLKVLYFLEEVIQAQARTSSANDALTTTGPFWRIYSRGEALAAGRAIVQFATSQSLLSTTTEMPTNPTSETATSKPLLVALSLRQPAHVVLAMLGLLAAAVPFVPLNPDAPKARNQQLIDTFKGVFQVVVIDDEHVRGVLEGIGRGTPAPSDEPSQSRFMSCQRRTEALVGDAETAASIAAPYFIFTSGTSGGMPKAVVGCRAALVAYAQAFGGRWGLGKKENKQWPPSHNHEDGGAVILAVSAPTFDPFIADVFMAVFWQVPMVVAGGTVSIFTEKRQADPLAASVSNTPLLRLIPSNLSLSSERTPAVDTKSVLCELVEPATSADVTRYIHRLVASSGFTHCTSTPAVFAHVNTHALLAAGHPSAQRPVVCLGGEAMTPELAQRLSSAFDLFNIFGVTEATVYQCAMPMRPTMDLASLSLHARSLGPPILPGAVRVAVRPLPPGDSDDDNTTNGKNPTCIDAANNTGNNVITGELILAGPLVCPGYFGLSSDDPRSQKFFHMDLSPAEVTGTPKRVRAYATGDIIRIAVLKHQESPGTVTGGPFVGMTAGDRCPDMPAMRPPVQATSVTLVGRVDFQVKINGQRTSLEEVEALSRDVLRDRYLSCPSRYLFQPSGGQGAAVEKVAACLMSSGTHIALYVSLRSSSAHARSDDGDTAATGIACIARGRTRQEEEDYCRSEAVRLVLRHSGAFAQHMVPRYVILDVDPAASSAGRTANGKSDRKTLQRLLEARVEAMKPVEDAFNGSGGDAGAMNEPMDGIRALCAEAWTSTLGIGAVRPSSRFVHAGGDSLLAARLMGRLLKALAAAGYCIGNNNNSGNTVEGYRVDGTLPTALSPALLLNDRLPTASFGGLCAHVRSAVSSAEPLKKSGGTPSSSDGDGEPARHRGSRAEANASLTARTSKNQAGAQLPTTAAPQPCAAVDAEDESAHTMACIVDAGSSLAADVLLSTGVVVLARRRSGTTATLLHTATLRDDAAMAELLLHHGAGVTDTNHEHVTPAFLAVQHNRLAMLKMFVRRFPQPLRAIRDSRCQGLLHAAARVAGTDDVLAFALGTMGLDPEARDCWQRTPLHWAAANDNVGALTLFCRFFEVNNFVNVNKKKERHVFKDAGARTMNKAFWAALASKTTSKPFLTLMELVDTSPTLQAPEHERLRATLLNTGII